ncbi:MAG: glycosyltransferase, partial [Planctomycetota bacterium]
VARVRPEWSFVLIGKVGEGDPWTDVSVLRALENVHLVGPRAYADLPACLKGMDVAILPNRLNEYTAHMFPMKFFEYLAAGKPVVSVPLPALQDFSQVATCAADAADFVRGIEAALAGRGPTRDERLAVARQYTYRARTGRMLALIEKLPPRGATAKREGAP